MATLVNLPINNHYDIKNISHLLTNKNDSVDDKPNISTTQQNYKDTSDDGYDSDNDNDNDNDNNNGYAQIYVPLQFWFNLNSGLTIPLIALQYHEFNIKINVSVL